MVYRKNNIKIEWSESFAYIIGLIASDGNLSNDGRHIIFTSKDKSLVLLFKKNLSLKNKIGIKTRDTEKIKKYYVLQFGNIKFYKYLVSIGITAKKSKTIEKVLVPNQFFSDFLRGCIDGDGSISIFNHSESKHKQLKLRLYSASYNFIIWIHKNISKIFKIKGGAIYKDPKKSVYALSYGKHDGGKILSFMYYKRNLPCLKRKRILAEKWASGEIG